MDPVANVMQNRALDGLIRDGFVSVHFSVVLGLVWAHLVPYFHVSVALRALSWKIRQCHVARRACLKSNSIEAHEKLRQRQGKLTSTWAKTLCTFWSFFFF